MLNVIIRLATEIIATASINCSANIVFAGDAMQHKAQITAARQSDGSYSYDDCFSAIAPLIESADYAIVNLETPLGGYPYRGYPCFSAPDSYAMALRDAGFDLMLTANNHTLDCRDNGLKRTISVLDSLQIPHIGTYTNSADRKKRIPFIADINGFKVGFLNYTYGTNGIERQGPVVVDIIDRHIISKDIAATRRAGAEIICVAVHWGDEYRLLPNASQKSLAHFLTEQGVDIIFGGHPHVIQPMELNVNPVTGRNTALIYSLGNFISNMKTRDTRGGALANVTIRRDSIGMAYVDALSYKLIFTVPPSKNNSNFSVHPAEDAPAGNYTYHKKAFIDAAQSIFNSHNVSVTPWPTTGQATIAF